MNNVKVDLSKLEKMTRQSKKLNKYTVQVGVFDSFNAEKAHTAEYGNPSRHVPVRSFLRVPLKKNRKEMVNQIGKKLKSDMKKQKVYNAFDLSKLLGVSAENIVLGSFGKNNWKKNAPSTIKRKGKDQPNVDTGQMRDAIRSQIVKK